MESFKPLIAKVAAGSQLSRADAAAAVRRDLLRRSDAVAVGRFLMAQGCGRNRRGDHRRGHGDARQDVAGRRAAAPRSTVVGTGRRRLGSFNVSTARGVDRRRLPRAGRQNTAIAPLRRSRGRPTPSPRSASRSASRRRRRALHPRSGNRLSCWRRRINAAMRHGRPDPRRTQATRTIFNCLGRWPTRPGQTPVGRVFSAAWLTPMAKATQPRFGAGCGSRTAPTPRRNVDHGTTKVVDSRTAAIRAFGDSAGRRGLTRVDLAALRAATQTYTRGAEGGAGRRGRLRRDCHA